MRVALVLICLAGIPPTRAVAAELEIRTIRAYDAYLEQAQTDFLSRVSNNVATPPPRDGVMSAHPVRGDGMIDIPGGLIHHWIGTAFVRGITLQKAVDVSSAYAEYSTMYKSIILSRLLGREGDTYRALIRLREGAAAVSVVLEIRSTVRYFTPNSQTVYALSNADEIREVKNAGQQNEQLLLPGRDSGYLWRANTLTLFREQKDGVYVEMETIGLSRRFPRLLGWILEPIARRLGLKSVETSLLEFLAAVRTASA